MEFLAKRDGADGAFTFWDGLDGFADEGGMDVDFPVFHVDIFP